VGITTEATEITKNNSLSGSVYSVCSAVDFKLTQYRLADNAGLK
jgi:hypothetical protein